jgi:hypothetical protein
MRGGRCYNVVEALKAVRFGVDSGWAAFDKGLEVDSADRGNCGYVIEAPDSEDFQACLPLYVNNGLNN